MKGGTHKKRPSLGHSRQTKHRKGSRMNRRKQSRNNRVVQSVVVVGRVYADWCGHCRAMAKDWEKIKDHFETQTKKYPHSKTKYEVISINSDEMSVKKPQVEKMYLSNTEIVVKGYPTIFRIIDGKLDYYSGARTYSNLVRWFAQRSPKVSM
jgi:thiol-disulfide isomerase/thioredoxin